jgi:hypothetical protein
MDGWGHRYTYNPAMGTIASLGNGKYPMTVSVADSLTQLYSNTISGTITDRENNPPGDRTDIMVDGYLSSGKQLKFKIPDPGGYYEFSPLTFDTVPIGTHRLVARMGNDTLVRWVTVAPRSRTIVDFRFSKSFRNRLRMVGEPTPMPDGSGFLIRIVNDGETEVPVTGIFFKQAPDSAYMRELWVGGSLWWTAPVGANGISQGDTAAVDPSFPVPPDMKDIEFAFQQFHTDSLGDSALGNIGGDTFLFRFSDGSEIKVIP